MGYIDYITASNVTTGLNALIRWFRFPLEPWKRLALMLLGQQGIDYLSNEPLAPIPTCHHYSTIAADKHFLVSERMESIKQVGVFLLRMETWRHTFPRFNPWYWISGCFRALRASQGLQDLFLATLVQVWELNVQQDSHFDTFTCLCDHSSYNEATQAGFLFPFHFSHYSSSAGNYITHQYHSYFYLKYVVFLFLYFFSYLVL